MGNESSTRVSQLTEVLNQVTSDVLVKSSAGASQIVNLDQSFIVTGNTNSVIKGVTMNQAASVNVSVLQDSKINSQMQADLVNKIISSLEQESSSGFPELTSASSNTEIISKVKNIVSSNLSVQSLATLQTQITAAQSTIITGNTGTTVDTIKLIQKADAVGKLINSMSGSIASAVTSDTSSDTSVKQKNTNFLVGIVDSIGNTISNVTSFSPMTLVVILIAIIVAAMTYSYTVSGGGHGSAAEVQLTDSSPYISN